MLKNQNKYYQPSDHFCQETRVFTKELNSANLSKNNSFEKGPQKKLL